MTENLGGVVRAIAREEGAAAELERPYSAALRERYVRDVRRRRAAGVAGLALVTAVVLGGGALGADRLARDLPPVDIVVTDPSPTWTPSPTWESTPSQTPIETLTPTPTETPTTPPPAPEPEDQETTPPPPPPAPPAPPTTAPTGVVAAPGGGSGEALVLWDLMPGATGYRVYRTTTPGGPFLPAASYDVATGVTTVEYSGYEYIFIQPEFGSSTQLRYTEAVSMDFVWFRVSAFNAGGEGPLSGITCAEPQNGLSPQVSEC